MSDETTFCPDCAIERGGWSSSTEKCQHHKTVDVISTLTKDLATSRRACEESGLAYETLAEEHARFENLAFHYAKEARELEAERDALRLALETATRERDDIAAWAESWMKRVAAAERERDEARAAALVAVEERRSFQKAHDLSERHRGPLERVRSAAYDLFQALDWEAPGWRDETCAERGDATNKAWFELEAALNFAAECDSSHSRPAPPADGLPLETIGPIARLATFDREGAEVLVAALKAKAPPADAATETVPLRADDVEWVVNSIAELGVKIGDQFFFLYKGESLVYTEGEDDEPPLVWRHVGKREFGECCHPINDADPTKYGTVDVNDGRKWRPLLSTPAPAPSAPAMRRCEQP